MSSDLYVSLFRDGETVPFPRAWVHDEFGAYVVGEGGSFLELRFPDGGESCLHVARDDRVDGVTIIRPCRSPELARGIMRLLMRSTVVVYGPDVRPVIGQAETRSHLSVGLVEALGEPLVAADPAEILTALFDGDR